MRAESTNVGFCENGAGYGGAVISLAAMLEHLPARFRPCIYTGLGNAQYQALAALGAWTHLAPVQTVSHARLRASGVPFVSSLDNLLNVLPFAFKFYRMFRRQKIDLVYLNNDVSCNLAAALAGKFARLPLVLHARGFNLENGGTRWMLANLAHCIAVSHAVKDDMLALGLAPEKITVVPEGLDLNAFRPRPPQPATRAELGIGEHEPVITLVAGLVDWKGQDVLLDAAPAILAQWPNAHILLVGAAYGKQRDFADMIARRAADPALNGRVRMLGARADIPDVLSISTIVLHTSTHPEPFGRTFLEGMALGKAVIASNEGGPLDVIDDGVDGLLITPRDPRVLAAAILGLLADPARAADMAARAAIKAQRFSIENHTAAIAAVLDKVRGFPIPPQQA
jgi:glycosyltransferase involved in cell wall biosynthesis